MLPGYFGVPQGERSRMRCSEAQCFIMGGAYGRASGSVVSICSVSAAMSIFCGDSSSSVAFIVLFGRRVRVSSKCRRLIWPNAIRLNGNAPIAVMPNGLVDARMAAVSKPSSPSRATPLLDGLAMVSVLFVMMNSPFIWVLGGFSSRAASWRRARSLGPSKSRRQSVPKL